MGLFTPAWKSKNKEKALIAVEKITDQKKLARAVKEAKIWQARAAAVAKLIDRSVLADVAKNDSSWKVRAAAYRQLGDEQSSLALIVINDVDYDVRAAAVAKLTDQIMLADVAKNDHYVNVRKAAVKNPHLTDRSVLADIAKNDMDWEICAAAYIQLGDEQSSLALIAKNGSAYNREAAVKKLTDQSVLADIAKNDRESYVRRTAVEKLTDQGVLADIAKNDMDWKTRAAAYRQLGDEQSSLALIAKNDDRSDVRKAAIEKLTDPEALRSVAEKYLSDICNIKEGKCDKDGWQKAESLILIAKRYPQLFKENWKEINSRIDALHSDYSERHCDMGSSDCIIPAVNETAASLGLHFPPYPFND